MGSCDLWSYQRDLRNRASQMETLGFLALCRLDVGRSCSEFFYWARAAGTFWSRFWYCHPLRRSPHRKGKKSLASIELKLREPSNHPMKPTAPLRSKFNVFAITPCRGLSLSRYAGRR